MITEEVLVQVGLSALLFVWLWFTLGNHFFASFFRLLEEREKRTVGDKEEAKDRLEDTEKVKGAIEHILSDARTAGVMERDSRVEKAKTQAAAIVADAREHAERELAAARAEIAQLKVRAREDLPQEAAELARGFVERALQDQKASYLH